MNERRRIDAEYAQLIEQLKSGANGIAKGRARSREFARAKIAARIAEHDAKVLPAIREYRRQGLGFLRCAQMMNLGDLPTPRGSGGWTATTVKRVCDRHAIERGPNP